MKKIAFFRIILSVMTIGILFSSCSTYSPVVCSDFERNGINITKAKHFFLKNNLLIKKNITQNKQSKNKNRSHIKPNNENLIMLLDSLENLLSNIPKSISIASDSGVVVNEMIYRRIDSNLIASKESVINIKTAMSNTATRLKSTYLQKDMRFNDFRKEMKSIRDDFNKDIKKIIMPKRNTASMTQKTSGNGSGLSIASFVLSIIGLIVAALICGILAIIFGGIGLARGGRKGLAIAGLIIGIIDVIMGILILAGAIAGVI